LAGVAALFAAAPVLAEEPPPICYNVVEAGMSVFAHQLLEYGLRPPPEASAGSGVVVENYWDAGHWQGGAAPARPSLPELQDFRGVRIVHCASGRFLAVKDGPPAHEAIIALASTEFLRPTLRAGGEPSWEDLRRAADALYPGAIAMRETAETCGCAEIFPELRPAGMVPFAQRDDVHD
jgi:hypothetical protein